MRQQRGGATTSANTPTGAYLTAHVVQQPQSNVATVLPSAAIIPSNSGVLPSTAVLTAQIQPSQIQTTPMPTQQQLQQQQNQQMQQQTMAQIPQVQVSFDCFTVTQNSPTVLTIWYWVKWIGMS